MNLAGASGPFLSFAFALMTGQPPRSTPESPHPGRVLFAFEGRADSQSWHAVHDGVMGGLSEGGATVEDPGRLTFRGTVALENNGGFASIRSRGETLDLSDSDGIRVRVRGDGRRYAMSVRTDFFVLAGAYYHDFDTRANEWVEITLPFSAFEVRSFGRPMQRAPKLNRARICSIGFIISDKQAGPFRLDIEWIRSDRDQDPPLEQPARTDQDHNARPLGKLAEERQ